MAKIEGNYVPSASQWVRDQIEQYERSGGTEANGLPGSDTKVIVVTMRGAEYDEWWQRSVAAFPNYEEYRSKTDRRIPILLAEPR